MPLVRLFPSTKWDQGGSGDHTSVALTSISPLEKWNTERKPADLLGGVLGLYTAGSQSTAPVLALLVYCHNFAQWGGVPGVTIRIKHLRHWLSIDPLGLSVLKAISMACRRKLTNSFRLLGMGSGDACVTADQSDCLPQGMKGPDLPAPFCS